MTRQTCAVVIFLILQISPIPCQKPSVVQEFHFAVENEKHFLVLFTEPCCDCKQCLDVEGTLKAISQEVGIELAKVVEELDLFKEYGVTKFPTVMFIRNKKPILYEGKPEKDLIVDWISENSESHVKQLDDETFEHLTQASTGATTGDWLTIFCDDCTALLPVIEAVGARIWRKMNVAVVMTSESPKLAARFNIKSSPTTLFFRHGKYYRYDGSMAILKLVSFAQRHFKDFKATPVPTPKSPFDEFTEDVVKQIRSLNPMATYGLLGSLLGLCLVVLLLRCTADRSKRAKVE